MADRSLRAAGRTTDDHGGGRGVVPGQEGDAPEASAGAPVLPDAPPTPAAPPDGGPGDTDDTTDGEPTTTDDDPADGEVVPAGRFGWWLAAVVLGGFLVRLAYLVVWRDPWQPVGDPYYYHHGANLLADGEGFVHPYRFLLYGTRSPGADHPPGLITVLAGFSWLGLRTFFQHQVIACVLGAAGVGAMGLAGRRIAGERVGLIVAVLTALSPNVFWFDPVVVSETLVVSTTGLVLWAAYRWWDRPSVRVALWFGVAVGLAAMVRSEAVLLGPAIGLPLVWFRRRHEAAEADRGGWAPGLRQLAAAGLLCVVVIGPWVAYNMARFEEPTTLSAQFDQTLGTANCDDVYYGDRIGYWQLGCIQRVEYLVGDGDASAQGRGFQRIAREYVSANTRRVPYVVGARVGRTFGLFAPQNMVQLDLSVESKERRLGQAGLATWYGVAVAGAVGLVGLRRAGRPIFPLVATVGSVAVTVALIYGTTRFRLPAELALMIPAAVTADAGLSAGWRRWRAYRSGEREARAARRTARRARRAPATDTPADPPGGLGSSAGHFAGFDGLRAIAALGVLVCHVGLQTGWVGRNPGAGPWVSRADVGVALFFVLSGFLLYRPFVAARMDGRAGPGVRRYLRNRFLRIFPAYWLALTVLAVVVDARGRDDINGWGDIVVYYGLLQSYSKANALGGLQQAWTLVNEVAFYLLLPVWAVGAGALARRLKPRLAVAAELAVLALAAAGALGFRLWLHSFQANDPSLGDFDPRFHWIVANFHMFVPGMALAVALEWSRRRDRPLALLEALRRHPLLCWGAAAVAFWAVSTRLGLGVQVGATESDQAIAKELLYAVVGIALVLPVALAGATLPRSLRWLGTRAMVVLGVLSYGIYLWHEGVTDVYRDIANEPVLHGWFPGVLVVTFLGSVVLAGLSYLLVERPALSLKDKRRKLFPDWAPVRLPADAVRRPVGAAEPLGAGR